MTTKFRLLRLSVLITVLGLMHNYAFSQVGFDNSTRALYIFDLVAKYVNYGPGFADSTSFKIGVLVGDYDLNCQTLQEQEQGFRISQW